MKIYTETLKPQSCCDPESTPYAIGGVQVRKNCDGAWIAATDGRCLVVTHAEVEDVNDIPEDGIVVAAKAWPTKPVKKKLKGDDRAFVEIDPEKGEWKNSDDKFGKDGICEGRFPKIEQVIPTFDGNSIVVTLDVKLLSKIAEALCRKDVPDGERTMLTLLMNLDKAKGEDGKEISEDMFDPVVQGPIGVLGSGPGVGVVMPFEGGGHQGVLERFSSRQRRIVSDYTGVPIEEPEAPAPATAE